MITELEQEFFKVFGIEPYTYMDCLANYKLEDNSDCPRENCKWCGAYKKMLKIPTITDCKLPKLICILNSTNGINCTAYESKNISDLKKEILNECMSISDDVELKTKIQQLFKEEE